MILLLLLLQEALRQSESTCLYYPLYPATAGGGDGGSSTKPHSHIAALTEMVPIQWVWVHSNCTIMEGSLSNLVHNR